MDGVPAAQGPAPASRRRRAQQAAEAVAPLAVVNLGLSIAQATKVQGWLKRSYGYTGAIDGTAVPGTRAACKRLADLL
ncbi:MULTISPECIES: hypothetical protein [Streptomyces]|uniref:hypothetical protein n=1 Tax=Streptomyces TaxID=1883 RepID=UPI000D523209|nr:MULTISPECIES: hypothetical protein [Streptomyces]PVC63612.1 hypothetical protein DBP15_27160 [Streptomyces sp. CS065A]